MKLCRRRGKKGEEGGEMSQRKDFGWLWAWKIGWVMSDVSSIFWVMICVSNITNKLLWRVMICRFDFGRYIQWWACHGVNDLGLWFNRLLVQIAMSICWMKSCQMKRTDFCYTKFWKKCRLADAHLLFWGEGRAWRSRKGSHLDVLGCFFLVVLMVKLRGREHHFPGWRKKLTTVLRCKRSYPGQLAVWECLEMSAQWKFRILWFFCKKPGWSMIKGSLDEKLPSYEVLKMRENRCVENRCVENRWEDNRCVENRWVENRCQERRDAYRIDAKRE